LESGQQLILFNSYFHFRFSVVAEQHHSKDDGVISKFGVVQNAAVIWSRGIISYRSEVISIVLRDIVRSGMAKHVGVYIALEIAAPSLVVQKLFPLPVLLTAILSFGNRSTSTNVGQRWAVSCLVKVGVVENVVADFRIRSQFSSHSKAIFTSGLMIAMR